MSWLERQLRTFVKEHAQVVQKEIDPPYTMVKMRVKMDGEEYFGMGFAKCSKEDCFCASIGLRLAKDRALKQIQQQLGRHMVTDPWRQPQKHKKGVEYQVFSTEEIFGDAITDFSIGIQKLADYLARGYNG